jgi:AraC-like DNA-binding protein
MFAPHYAPRILNGRNGMLQGPLLNRGAGMSSYSAVLVQDGRALLQSRDTQKRLSLPAGVIIWPSSGARLEITPGSTWRQILFDVVPQPCRPGGGKNLEHSTSERQPSPADVWGVAPDHVVGGDLLSGFQGMMLYACSHWWRDDISRARADLALGAWLLDWIEAQLPNGADVPRQDDLLARVERQIQDALEFGVTVDDMASRAGMSRRHFQTVYREARGICPGEFLQQQRLVKAKKLLRTSTFRIGGVSAMCGYRSVSSFSRSFRAATGKTPSVWRRENRRS